MLIAGPKWPWKMPGKNHQKFRHFSKNSHARIRCMVLHAFLTPQNSLPRLPCCGLSPLMHLH